MFLATLRRLCVVLIALWWAIPAAYAAEAPTVWQVDIKSTKNGDIITLHLSRPVSYDSFALDNPDRLVMDFPVLDWHADNVLAGYRGALLKDVRVARFSPTTTRMVFDLNSPARLARVEVHNEGTNRPFLMVLSLQSEDGSATAVRDAPAQSVASPAPTPQAKPDWSELVEEKAPEPVHVAVPLPADFPFKNIPIPVLKDKVVFRKPVVVIDAGHGGKDPGAIGSSGTYEKIITLGYALELAEGLRRTGRYEVVLTRDNDSYVRLRERLAIGRRAKGDIFISLHADSAGNTDTRGLSIYTLSETASDKEAAALATRENKVDIIFNMDLSTEETDVTEILIDLAQRETKNKSKKLADTLLGELGKQVRLLPNTLRHAGFAVLKAPDVPSVLIEIGFLSNRKEEALLRSREFRDRVISALVNGVDRYFQQQNYW